MKKPSMQDIAGNLGISKNAVSLALSGRPGVSAELRERVFAEAKRLGYHIHKKNQPSDSHFIGLIAREEVFSEHEFFGVINLHIEKEIKSRGGNLLLHAVDKDSERELLLPSFLQNQKVDGLIVLSHLRTEYLKKILALEIPVVLVDHHDPELEVDSVLTDNRTGSYLATKHLIQEGARSVGFIGRVEKSPSYKERFEGYTEALKEAGISIETSCIISDQDEIVEELAEYIRTLSTLPDAWFCVNDHYGFLLTQVLSGMGYAIPEQAAICGFDDSLYATIAAPRLTTMSIDKQYFAKRSVIQLYTRMQQPTPVFEKILLKTELIERETVRKKS
ncbi:LacI family DNA-binding transcriptional regulator [Cytobacillus firmus]|uniref:LacI family DNA-binding transcriptional regulator n=2 Tax=Cytobacillus TaxID=2675230 RepID=UPI0020408BC4|nr:LacI family DNA-binding transcriptional regulator [Cytobacillus firmus]MCM3705994.1 LacI family DNA-binding transcriptional regulator [Cytobacillus firmus]